MQYEELIDDIFKRHPSVQNTGFNNMSYKAGIAPMIEFSRILGDPWKAYPCIHVAGTNGKGSVSCMMATALSAVPKTSPACPFRSNFGAGSKTGLYTSPHLLDFRERIKIVENGHFRMIPRDDVMEFLERFYNDITHLSFFEITTGMAFWWYRKEGVDYAVIETGLGGRLDSTNLIDPVISIITGIGLDHCNLLGDTLEKIAFEKAGIIKPRTPAVVWEKSSTSKIFTDKASATGAPLYFADEVIPDLASALPAGFQPDLKGDYQDINFRTALAALSVLGINPDFEALAHTGRICGLHGRWDILREKPLVIADIGHNPAALRKNFTQLEAMNRKTHIVYGIMADKALCDIIPLLPAEADYYLCAPEGSRALPVDELYTQIRSARPELNLSICNSVAGAVTAALHAAMPEDVIYIGGSNFVVAEIPLL